jgi:hypothetical protein
MIDDLRRRESFGVDALRPEEAQLVELLRSHRLAVAPNDSELFLTQPSEELYNGKAAMRSAFLWMASGKGFAHWAWSKIRILRGYRHRVMVSA